MKALILAIVLVLAALAFPPTGQAQYKAPSQYFPKSYPAPSPRGSATPGGTNAPAKRSSDKPQPSKFKDLAVNIGFYFISDTNHTYLWTKTTATQAKNTKNGVTQTIAAETPVQK